MDEILQGTPMGEKGGWIIGLHYGLNSQLKPNPEITVLEAKLLGSD